MPRPINIIARDIAADWETVHPWAMPYFEAMCTMRTVGEGYGTDTGEEVILYFLSNAKTWRGPKAREIKAELRAMLAR